MLVVYFLIISILFNAEIFVHIILFKCQKMEASLTETEKINVPGFDVFVY